MANNNGRLTIYTAYPRFFLVVRRWFALGLLICAQVSIQLVAQSSTPQMVATTTTAVSFPPAQLQIFGDVFVDSKFLYEVRAETNPLGVSDDLLRLLHSSPNNVVNFEGVATNHKIKFGDKIFHLQMPTHVPQRLTNLGVNLATLGNNHSMDFGLHGLFDSLALLKRSGIRSFGADLNAQLASSPAVVVLPDRSLCLFSFAKTYPASTWATARFAGTANPPVGVIDSLIKKCHAKGMSSIVIFHWGRELEKTPQPYQRDLARACIDSGAIAVIGHHPHVLQEVEVYKGVPIFYSIGNFLFSSLPTHSVQEGAVIRLTFDGGGPLAFDVVQLQVNNRLVKFRTRLLQDGEKSALDDMLKIQGPACQKKLNPGFWSCQFAAPTAPMDATTPSLAPMPNAK